MRHVLTIILIAMVPTSSTQNANDRDAVLKVVQIFLDSMFGSFPARNVPVEP